MKTALNILQGTILFIMFLVMTPNADAVIESIANIQWSTIIQDWWVNWWYTKKITFRNTWSSSDIVLDIRDINNDLLGSGIAWRWTINIPLMINLNNWKYVWLIQSNINLNSSIFFLDSNTNSITDYRRVSQRFDSIALKHDPSWNPYLVFQTTNNVNLFYVNILSGDVFSCNPSCGQIDIWSYAFTDSSIVWDFIDFSSENFYQYNYINQSLFFTSIIGETSVLHISNNTWNSIKFWPLNSLNQDFNWFVSQHVRFYVDSLDIANNTIKITSSSFDDKVYIYEYSILEQSLNLLWIAENEFFIWYFNWEFQSIPFDSDLLDNTLIRKDTAFIWFSLVNWNMEVTTFDTLTNSWIIDGDFIPITYTVNEVFATSVSWTGGGCSWSWCFQPWVIDTSYDSSVWDWDKDGDGDVSIGELFSWIAGIPKYFIVKILDFFANVRDFVLRILDVFTTEEKTFTFIQSANALETSIMGSVINVPYENSEESYNETMLWKYVKFIYAFVYSLILIVAIAIYIQITHPKDNA